MTKRTRVLRTILYIFLAVVAILEITPLLLALANSFRTNAEIKKSAIGFTLSPEFSNYVKAWTIGGYGRAFINSAIISVLSSTLVLVCAVIGGYFLARVNSKFTRFVQAYFGVALSLPVFAYLIPVYYAFAEANLVNTRTGMVILYAATNIGFNLMLASTFIKGIPEGLDEAATIDGCTIWQTICKIIFPLAKPIITTIILIVFVSTWNEFTLANTFLQQTEMKTAATRYVLFCGEKGSDLSLIYAAGIITMLPIVILFLCLQNYFIEGMTAGSIKE